MRPLLARSQRREIIDERRMSPAEAAAVFRNLATINRFLGGYQVTLEAVRRLVPAEQKTVRILDVGAGGGDMARTLTAWGRTTGRHVTVVSVDIDAAAIRFARESLNGAPDATLLQADAGALPFGDDTFDVVTCALFMHHMPWDVGDRILRALWAVSRHGVVINDLHRHPFACGAIWLLTRLLGAHPIVQHDAPLSVLRGFSRAELLAMGRRVGLPLEVRWRWAFRYLGTVPKRWAGNAAVLAPATFALRRAS
jgi:SAM-dependent methyltransferase